MAENAKKQQINGAAELDEMHSYKLTLDNYIEDEYIQLEEADIALSYFLEDFFNDMNPKPHWQLNYHAMQHRLTAIHLLLTHAIETLEYTSGNGGTQYYRDKIKALAALQEERTE